MKKILMVMDLDMKRQDSSTDFNRQFLQAANARNIKVRYLLPKAPCDHVRHNLLPYGFEYAVLNQWHDPSTPDKKHIISIVHDMIHLQRQERFDLIAFHFCSIYTVSAFSLLSRILGIRPILVWHQHAEIRSRLSNTFVRHISRYITTARLFTALDHICAVSHAVKNQLIAKNVSTNKITVIHNGVLRETYNSIPKFRRTAVLGYFSANFKLIVTTVSNIIPEKGLDTLLRAIAIVRDKYPRILFLIVGEGPDIPRLMALANSLDIVDQIHFTGLRNDVPDILCVSDFVVLPTLREALSYVVIESMASSKAIIASDVGGIPELVSHGQNGMLVPPGNPYDLATAIETLAENRKLRFYMGQAGLEKVRDSLTVQQCVEKHHALYRDLYLRGT